MSAEMPSWITAKISPSLPRNPIWRRSGRPGTGPVARRRRRALPVHGSGCRVACRSACRQQVDSRFAATGFLTFAASGFPPFFTALGGCAATSAAQRTQRRQSTQRAFRPRIATDAAQAEILDLEELLDPVLRSFAAEARFLHAAERRHLGRDDPGVDADDPVFERFGDAPDAADVAAVEVRGEAELRVVGQRDRLRFGRRSGTAARPGRTFPRARPPSPASRRSAPSARKTGRRARDAGRRPAPSRPSTVASAMWLSTFSTALSSISGPCVAPASSAGRRLQLRDGVGQLRGERVVDARPAPAAGSRRRRSARCCGTSTRSRPPPPHRGPHRRTR